MDQEGSFETTAPLSGIEVFGIIAFALVWFGVTFFIFRGMWRAYSVIPRELTGIRAALERIADHLDRRG